MSNLNQVMIKSGRYKCPHEKAFEKLHVCGTKENRGTEEETHPLFGRSNFTNIGLERDRRGRHQPGCKLLEDTKPQPYIPPIQSLLVRDVGSGFQSPQRQSAALHRTDQSYAWLGPCWWTVKKLVKGDRSLTLGMLGSSIFMKGSR